MTALEPLNALNASADSQEETSECFARATEVLKAQDGLRKLVFTAPTSPDADGAIIIDGKPYIDFSSNDSLGLAHHPALMHAAVAATQSEGTSSASSRLILGSSTRIRSLETTVARWQKTEAALVFNSGYQLNCCLPSALAQPGDVFFMDKACHASLVDGVILACAKTREVTFKRFQHQDFAHLARLLAQTPVKGQRWIVTESLFSMGGDVTRLPDLCTLAAQFQGRIILDEAHAVGLYGGSQNRFSGFANTVPNPLRGTIALVIGTFGKALGSQGAFVAAPQELIDWLVQSARGFVYSTALPPGVIAASQAALELVLTSDALQNRLFNVIDSFNAALSASENLGASAASESCGLVLPKIGATRSHIVPVMCGSNTAALMAQAVLQAKGLWVHAIRPPTVKPGQAMLRISLSARHAPEQVQALVSGLQGVLVNSKLTKWANCYESVSF
ncbi:MAG: 8-amino-7-oxononanoate synthase [Vampirovibrionales bacterium]|nr:8-amino-7-oxononanoate synthase [Vampirovibrionales bacterium]